MKPESPPARQARRLPHVPPFYPVPVRSRRDGWTRQKQTDFLGFLVQTGSVLGACEAVGMSRNSAYKLRARPQAASFAAAWDAALGLPAPKVTVQDLRFVAVEGLIRLRFFRGRYVGSSQKPDSSALLRLIGRLDRLLGEGEN